MTYHSDFDSIGFRKEDILKTLGKHGLTIDFQQQEKCRSVSEPLTQMPGWKLTLSLRRRLGQFEAACALANVDPFSEAHSVTGYGMNVPDYEMYSALLNEAIDMGRLQVFETRVDDTIRSLIDAKEFCYWCDELQISRPLPWKFEPAIRLNDSELQQRNADLVQQLCETRGEVERLKAELVRMQPEAATIEVISPAQQQTQKSNLSFVYETPLLRMVSAVQKEFLSTERDYRDPDMRPPKEQIVEWIMQQDSDLKRPTAYAVDRIAMPFSRGK